MFTSCCKNLEVLREEKLTKNATKNVKLANAQTERSEAATRAVLVTESQLGPGYLFCYVTAEPLYIAIRFNFICHMWNNPSDIYSIFKKYPQQ